MSDDCRNADRCFLLAGYAISLLQFRGALIEELVARGFEVHLAAPGLTQNGEVANRLRDLGATLHDVPIKRTGTSPIEDALLLVHLVRLFRCIRPSLVLSYTIKPVIYGTLAAWLAGVPRRVALITGLGYTLQESGNIRLLRWLVRCLYRVSLSRANLIFFQNVDDERCLRELATLPASVPSQVVNGSGVDLNVYSPVALPGGGRFLLIARLLGAKGVREYAEAARQIKSTHPAALFRLAGWIDEGPDAVQMDELSSWIAAGTLEYLGRLVDVRPALADCTVFVLPSYSEGMPRTVLEAMAMGRAVITTDAPGCRETVRPGENGFLVPVRSSDALETAMRRFLADPGLAARMGARSRCIAVEKYDVRKVNAEMLRAMELL